MSGIENGTKEVKAENFIRINLVLISVWHFIPRVLMLFAIYLKNFFRFFLRRNRLESNSEHWNALLLSLRELTEWVIRKDTELSQLRLGPLRGDAASLQKQLVSVAAWTTEQKVYLILQRKCTSQKRNYIHFILFLEVHFIWSWFYYFEANFWWK